MSKKALIITGITLAVLGTATAITLIATKPRRDAKKAMKAELEALKKAQEEAEAKAKKEAEDVAAGIIPSPSNTGSASTRISPTRNSVTRDINNPFDEVKGRPLLPTVNSSDPIKGHDKADGYVNVRSSAEVNSRNLITKIDAPKYVGLVIGETFDNMSPKHRWFKVQLVEPITQWTYPFVYKEGWVRADNVSFKSFDKKSSNFSGKMITKYDNSYQLGAEVFPHSNWMSPMKKRRKFELDENIDLFN